MNKKFYIILIFLQVAIFICFLPEGLQANNSKGQVSGPPQPFSVNGKVISASDNMPLPGVNVIEVGTRNGTITNSSGEYTLEISSSSGKIEFSFIGYLNVIQDVAGRNIIDVVLYENPEELEEVVVIGYGTAKRADLTGAVSSVNASEMKKIATPSIENALQGRAAGVYVTKNNGGPGEGASIFVRGPGSIGSSGPLWVIDGIPSEAGNTFDMSTVESVDILKDASAAAIYGARAANGVILVTTKRGTSGKMKVGYNSYFAQTQAIQLPDLVNAMEYAQTKTQSQLNAGLADKTTGLIPAEIYQKYANGDTALFFPDGTPIGEGTRWFDVLFDKGSMQNHNFYLSGGSEFMNFYTSVDYLKEKGTALRSLFERYTIVLNSDYKPGKFITFGESFQLSYTDRTGADHIINEQMMRVNPFMPVMDETRNLPYPYENFGIVDKNVYDFDPPSHYGMTMVDNKSEKWYQMRGAAYVDIKPIKDLSWKSSLGTILKNKNYNYYGERYDMGSFFRHEDILEQSVNYESNMNFNSVLSYNKAIGKHSFVIMAGTELKKFYGTTMVARKDSFPIDLVTFNSGNVAKASVGGDYLDPEKWISYFSRINYNFDNKYLFQVNFRRDGCSVFGPNKRYGNFPSFSAGWRITNEPFMEALNPVMDLKIRGGWGVLGNSSIPKFRYLSTVNSNSVYYSWGEGPNQPYVLGAYPDAFPNKEVHWEEFVTTNIGFDLGLFHSALLINADIYKRTNRGMLIPVDLPFSSGYYRPWNSGNTTINSGEVTNKGYEISATYHKSVSGINLSVSGNIAYNKNNIENLYSDNAIIKGEWSQYVTEAGMPMSYYKGFIVERIYQATSADTADILMRAGVTDPTKYNWSSKLAPGDFKFKDINGDTIINDEDKVMIGNPWPKYIYGLNITAMYKGFDLSLFIQGVAGNDIFNRQKRYTETFTGDYSPTKDILESWTPENPDASIPRLNYKDPNRNFSRSSSYFVEKGDYLRLKNVSIGYTFPDPLMELSHLSNLRIYFTAQNVFTITKYSGLDPEFSSGDNTQKNEDNGTYPQNKLYQLGIQVEF